MDIQVKDTAGEAVGEIVLDDCVWGAPSNDALLHQVVVAQLANKRHGTHESQTRAQPAYSTRKLYGQKNTGRARLGSRRSPTMVGGGTIFGPHLRSYRQRVPKKMRQQALRIALSDKARDGRLTVLDGLAIESPRTREMSELVERLGIQGRTLLVVSNRDSSVSMSSRGLPGFEVSVADMLNPTITVRAANLVVTREAALRIDQLWGRASNASEAGK